MTDKSREKAIKHASSMVNNYTSSIALYHGSRHPELINFIPQAREQLNMWESILHSLENARDNTGLVSALGCIENWAVDRPFQTYEEAFKDVQHYAMLVLTAHKNKDWDKLNAQCRPACGVCEICTR